MTGPRSLIVGSTRLAALVLAAGCATSPQPTTTAGTAVSGGWSHGLVIDASSSASTHHAYRWRPDARGGLPRIEAEPLDHDGDCRPVEPGLGDYAGRPEAAAASLEPLLRCAVELVGADPGARARASLYLRGTAGLRLLPAERQREILAAVRAALAATPFGSTSARVIGGDEEGVYGWLAVNYLLGHLEHGGPFPTVGALDLGGGSAQITFVPLDRPREHGQSVTLAGNTYHLYTYSYLGLGQDQARKRFASPACYLSGYPLPGGGGTGDYAACRAHLRGALAEPCDRGPCSLFGAYQPPLYGDLLAFSVYAYTARFFGLEGRLSPAELESAGEAFCARSWRDLIAEDPSAADDPFVPNYCFAAAYAVTLLTDGFGLPLDTERLHAPLAVQGVKVGWALGALLYELAGSGD